MIILHITLPHFFLQGVHAVPIVCGEGAVIRPVPRVVQRVAGIPFVSINFQFVILSLGVDLEV